MSRLRFSKALARDYMRQRIMTLVERYKFDLNNGTAQLRPGDMDRSIAYGQVRELETLAINLGIDWRGHDSRRRPL